MPPSAPTLHMLCGKIGSGKSTLAARLGRVEGTVLIAEDDWLSALFSEEMSSPKDYMRCAAKLRAIMGPHVVSLLKAGVSVVLDFPANTTENRTWMRGILAASNASHQLHVMATPDEICLERLHARNAKGDHPFAATEAQFQLFSKYFAEPTADEGFNIVLHGPEEADGPERS